MLISVPDLRAEEPGARRSPGAETGDAQSAPPLQTAAATPQEHPLRPAIRLASESLKRLESVEDYEAVLTKRERVNGELRTGAMLLKFRESPFSVYLKFRGEVAGREVLYVEGRNRNLILAHEGGGLKALVGTVALAPNSPEALAESRHSITDIGLRNMLRFMIDRWQEEAKYGECNVQYYPNARLGDRECIVIECRHPTPRRQFRFHISRLYLDKETDLPVRVENFGFPATPGGPPVLMEEYTYSNIRTNIGLTDADFDRNNPNYNF